MNGSMICNVKQTNTWNTSRFWIYYKFLKQEIVPHIKGTVSFILNPRDHPLVKLDKNEFPYDNVIVEENKTYVAPTIDVFSHYVNKEYFADKGFPTIKDIQYMYYKQDLSKQVVTTPLRFEDKISKAVFRGSATGCGVAEQNQRIILCLLATRYPNMLDCKLTSLNMRDRICPKEKKMTHLLPVPSLDISKRNYMSDTQQQTYKYQIIVDGWCAADRLGPKLNSGCLLFIVESAPFQKTRPWFYTELTANIHYVSINKDLSNLLEMIEYFNEHIEEAKKIIENAKQLHEKILSKSGIVQHVLKNII